MVFPVLVSCTARYFSRTYLITEIMFKCVLIVKGFLGLISQPFSVIKTSHISVRSTVSEVSVFLSDFNQNQYTSL